MPPSRSLLCLTQDTVQFWLNTTYQIDTEKPEEVERDVTRNIKAMEQLLCGEWLNKEDSSSSNMDNWWETGQMSMKLCEHDKLNKEQLVVPNRNIK